MVTTSTVTFHLDLVYLVQLCVPRYFIRAELSSPLQANWLLSAIVGNENILCEHHLQRSADAIYDVTTRFHPKLLTFKVSLVRQNLWEALDPYKYPCRL